MRESQTSCRATVPARRQFAGDPEERDREQLAHELRHRRPYGGAGTLDRLRFLLRPVGIVVARRFWHRWCSSPDWLFDYDRGHTKARRMAVTRTSCLGLAASRPGCTVDRGGMERWGSARRCSSSSRCPRGALTRCPIHAHRPRALGSRSTTMRRSGRSACPSSLARSLRPEVTRRHRGRLARSSRRASSRPPEHGGRGSRRSAAALALRSADARRPRSVLNRITGGGRAPRSQITTARGHAEAPMSPRACPRSSGRASSGPAAHGGRRSCRSAAALALRSADLTRADHVQC